jgi:hypothetical protein
VRDPVVFLHWSAEQAAAAGLTPARHRLLLAIRGLTADGEDRLARLTELHLGEIRRLAPQFEALWDGLGSHGGADAGANPPASSHTPPRR